ncbi:MAG TPA: hypothetical protein VLS89_00055 [Candidatus Nanopelagicales bacterium]|nr:hypothetical protein [Candidatus Nanopelagicales bacterium]
MSEALFATQVASLMEGSPPARLGRAWAEVVDEVRQRLAALDNAAAAAGAAAMAAPDIEPLPPADAYEPEVMIDEPGAGELITDENEIVLRRWGALRLFAEPIVVQTRGVTYDQWETSILPGLGLRFPIP